MKNIPVRWLLATLLWCGLCHAHSGTVEPGAMEADTQAITALLKGQFERPEAPLELAPISIVGSHAMVGWTQNEAGGRALLRKQRGQWRISLCAGIRLKTLQTLLDTGMSRTSARTLLEKVNKDEARLPTARIEQLSRFEGAMQHPTHDPHHP